MCQVSLWYKFDSHAFFHIVFDTSGLTTPTLAATLTSLSARVSLKPDFIYFFLLNRAAFMCVVNRCRCRFTAAAAATVCHHHISA